MGATQANTTARWADAHFAGALGIGTVLRLMPMMLWDWASPECTRDECIYKMVARPILEGDGLAMAPAGWLPAPGYPYLLAACHALFGSFESVKWVQLALLAPTLWLLWRLAMRLSGKTAARIVVWWFAIHPTFVFFTGTMWTETTYTTLLLSAMLATLWAREGNWPRALLPGLLLGLCVLSRGIATYLAPIFLMALLVATDPSGRALAFLPAARRRLRHAIAFSAAMLLSVGPYSAQASRRWGGPLISDATLGHVASLGNNTYEPMTFDYMIGPLRAHVMKATITQGRRACPKRRMTVVERDRCETRKAAVWAASHPGEFIQRIPLRLAQLVNPNSFLTRHLRWGMWPGTPALVRDALTLYQALNTAVLGALGTFASVRLAKGPMGILAAGTMLYTVAVVAALYGISRFRLPIEPLAMLYAAAWLAQRREAPEASPSVFRKYGAWVAAGIVCVLMQRFFWSGFPGCW